MASNPQRRKLAELIAKQKGIKVKSAFRYLQRAAAPEGKQRIINPTFGGISDYARRKAKKAVQVDRQRVKPVPRPAPRPAEDFDFLDDRLVSYPETEMFSVAINATFDFYGNDKRTRTIRIRMFGSELNDFLNSEKWDDASGVLGELKDAKFLKGATVRDLNFFHVDGKNFGKDHWDL